MPTKAANSVTPIAMAMRVASAADVDMLAVVDTDERFVGAPTLQAIRAHAADAGPAATIQRGA